MESADGTVKRIVWCCFVVGKRMTLAFCRIVESAVQSQVGIECCCCLLSCWECYCLHARRVTTRQKLPSKYSTKNSVVPFPIAEPFSRSISNNERYSDSFSFLTEKTPPGCWSITIRIFVLELNWQQINIYNSITNRNWAPLHIHRFDQIQNPSIALLIQIAFCNQ